MDKLEKPLQVINEVAKGDFAIANGALVIPGIAQARLNDIISLDVLHSRAEVSQKVTLSGAPTGGLVSEETYKLRIYVQRMGNQGMDRFEKEYYVVAWKDVTTDASGALAAILNGFVDRINRDIEIPVTASISGNDLVIADNPGYFVHGRGGASQVKVLKNNNGVGFDTSNLSITQAAVYSLGIGSDLAKKQFEVDPLVGNAYNGKPQYANLDKIDTGGKYTTVIINSLLSGNGVGMIADSLTMKWIVQLLLIKETATGLEEALSVLTEAGIQKAIQDSPSMAASGIYPAVTGAQLDGSVGASTAQKSMIVQIGDSTMYTTNIGANVLYPVLFDPAKGYKLDGTATNGIGRELCTNPSTDGPSFIVGKGAFSAFARVTIGTLAHAEIAVGFRKKENANATITGYSDYAAVGTIGKTAALKVSANLAGGTAYTSDPSIAAVADTYIELGIAINSGGYASAFIDGKEFAVESADGVPLKLAAGTELLGFVRYVGDGTASNAYAKSFTCVPYTNGKTIGGLIKS